jgi:hypothetical protein
MMSGGDVSGDASLAWCVVQVTKGMAYTWNSRRGRPVMQRINGAAGGGSSGVVWAVLHMQFLDLLTHHKREMLFYGTAVGMVSIMEE